MKLEDVVKDSKNGRPYYLTGGKLYKITACAGISYEDEAAVELELPKAAEPLTDDERRVFYDMVAREQVYAQSKINVDTWLLICEEIKRKVLQQLGGPVGVEE